MENLKGHETENRRWLINQGYIYNPADDSYTDSYGNRIFCSDIGMAFVSSRFEEPADPNKTIPGSMLYFSERPNNGT